VNGVMTTLRRGRLLTAQPVEAGAPFLVLPPSALITSEHPRHAAGLAFVAREFPELDTPPFMLALALLLEDARASATAAPAGGPPPPLVRQLPTEEELSHLPVMLSAARLAELRGTDAHGLAESLRSEVEETHRRVRRIARRRGSPFNGTAPALPRWRWALSVAWRCAVTRPPLAGERRRESRAALRGGGRAQWATAEELQSQREALVTDAMDVSDAEVGEEQEQEVHAVAAVLCSAAHASSEDDERGVSLDGAPAARRAVPSEAATARVEWAADGSLRLVAQRRLSASAPVRLDFGPRTNAELLVARGEVLVTNPHDAVGFHIEASTLAQGSLREREQLLQSRLGLALEAELRLHPSGQLDRLRRGGRETPCARALERTRYSAVSYSLHSWPRDAPDTLHKAAC